jgi:hypothetical protein
MVTPIYNKKYSSGVTEMLKKNTLPAGRGNAEINEGQGIAGISYTTVFIYKAGGYHLQILIDNIINHFHNLLIKQRRLPIPGVRNIN